MKEIKIKLDEEIIFRLQTNNKELMLKAKIKKLSAENKMGINSKIVDGWQQYFLGKCRDSYRTSLPVSMELEVFEIKGWQDIKKEIEV